MDRAERVTLLSLATLAAPPSLAAITRLALIPPTPPVPLCSNMSRWLPCLTPVQPSSHSTEGIRRAGEEEPDAAVAGEAAIRSDGEVVSLAAEVLFLLTRTTATVATRAAPITDSTVARTITVVLAAADEEVPPVDESGVAAAAPAGVAVTVPVGVAPVPLGEVSTAFPAASGGAGGGIGRNGDNEALWFSFCIARPVTPNSAMKALSKAVALLTCSVAYIVAAGWEWSMTAIESVATTDPGTIATTDTEEVGTCMAKERNKAVGLTESEGWCPTAEERRGNEKSINRNKP